MKKHLTVHLVMFIMIYIFACIVENTFLFTGMEKEFKKGLFGFWIGLCILFSIIKFITTEK